MMNAAPRAGRCLARCIPQNKGRAIMRDKLTAEELRKSLNYDPTTGVFRRVSSGKIAGCSTRGYLSISVLNVEYRAHRLAWLYVYECWPSGQLDHVNGIKDDNRIANLREATVTENQQNARIRKDNTTGFKGVFAFQGKYRTQIKINGRQTYLGQFDTAEEAHAAYCKAAKEKFGEFFHSGIPASPGVNAV